MGGDGSQARPARGAFALPHEDKRMREASGGKIGSMIGKLLIFEREAPFLNRTVALLIVRQKVGD